MKKKIESTCNVAETCLVKNCLNSRCRKRLDEKIADENDGTEERKPEDMKKDIAAFQTGQRVRARIENIIEEEGYENLRHDWKRLCAEVIGYHPDDAVDILQVLQQTEKISIVNRPPHPA